MKEATVLPQYLGKMEDVKTINKDGLLYSLVDG